MPHTIRYSVGDNRIDITLDDGAKSSLWWGTNNEWPGLLDVTGLELEALYGGFAREPFADDSGRYIFDFATPLALAIPNAWPFSEIASLQELFRPDLLRVGPRRPIQTRPELP